MELPFLIEQLRSTPATLRELLAPVNDEEGTWRPAPDQWSLLDVLNHLADEERVDFRCRLDLTLHHPEKEWPGIDPERAVQEEKYRNRSLREAIEDFIAERQHSLQWLEGLEAPDWSVEHTHPVFGSMSAGTLMASWVAHDLLHLRQIVRIRWEYLARYALPFSLQYAGDW